MAKCKDCIHNEVCDQSSRMMWATMEGKTECDDFKDRSRYVVREKGEWKYYRKKGIAVCTSCSFERKVDDNFGRAVACPNCGADMRKGENG